MSATSPSEKLKPKSFFVRYRTRIGLLYFLVMLPCLLFIRPSWLDAEPSGKYLYFIGHTIGYFCILAGVLGRLWCTLYIGGRKQCVLQTTGPYSLVRHPLYLGSMLLGLGLVAVSQNLAVLVVGLIYFIAQYRATIRYEEETLGVLFGEQHAEYVKRVPIFFPRLSSLDPTPPESVDMGTLQLEFARTVAFLVAIPFLELITILQTIGVIHYFHFPS